MPDDSLADARSAGPATVNLGVLLTTIIGILVAAFAMSLVIRALDRMEREGPSAARGSFS